MSKKKRGKRSVEHANEPKKPENISEEIITKEAPVEEEAEQNSVSEEDLTVACEEESSAKDNLEEGSGDADSEAKEIQEVLEDVFAEESDAEETYEETCVEEPYTEETYVEEPYTEEFDSEEPYTEEFDSEESYVEEADLEEEEAFTNRKEKKERNAELLSERRKSSVFEKELTHTESKDGEFMEFLSESGQRFAGWVKKNKIVCAWIVGAIVIIILFAVFLSAAFGEKDGSAMVSGNGVSENAPSANLLPDAEEPLRENEYPEVNELVNAYFAAVQANDIETLRSIRSYIDTVETVKFEVKSRYIEAYQNITCYTKTGPFENSWIVYVCYDVKLYDWEQLAPSLLTLFVCTNESGELYIYSGEFDENVANYILATNAQGDVEDLFNRVDTEYSEVMDANADFAAYMNALNEVIKNEVGELLIAESDQTVTTSENEAVSDNTVSENTTEEEPQQTEEEEGPFEVEATTTVNVRASDSEEADRIGQVAGGTVLLCNEQLANGWSQIVFEEAEDGIGYIKSEYLTVLGEDTSTPTQSADGVETNGSVRVTDTVNIRATADINGDRVGVAYQGETFEVVGDTDGEWIQIVYDGQLAYINADYIE